MSNDEASRSAARKMVTHVLAELGVYFDHRRLEDSSPVWRIFYAVGDSENGTLEVRIGFLETEWLAVQSLPLGTVADVGAERALNAQSEFAMACATVTDDGQVIAQVELPLAELRPPLVGRAIASVVGLATALRPR